MVAKKRSLAFFVFLIFSTSVSAALEWGEFAERACVADGKRQYSSVLWGIVGDEEEWLRVCGTTSAIVHNERFEAPNRCVVEHSFGTPVRVWGEFDVTDGRCSTVPKVDLNATVNIQPSPGPEVWGIADTHAHAFTHEGFGGLAFQGQPFHPGGFSEAMPWCDKFHGPGGVADTIGNFVDGTFGHKVGGYPEFDGWPRWNSSVHQQMYYEWIERAYLGGLRLQTMLAVNNEVLCLAASRAPGYGCDDMRAVDRQLAAVKEMEKFIDDKHGGPGQGWYRIAYSAQQARSIIQGGKMAVVLGIEVDALFECKVDECDPLLVETQLQKYYDLGVRHVLPIHVFDNAFGGAALYNSILEWGNLNNNNWEKLVASLVDGGLDYAEAWELVEGLILLPDSRSCAEMGYEGIEYKGGCNARSLQPLGEFLIKGMMDRGMIIDIDHMGAQTLEEVFKLASARKYPLVSGHTGFIDTSKGQKASEAQKSIRDLHKIRELGGLVAPILHQGNVNESKPYGHVPNDCDQSTKSWAQSYLYAASVMGKGVPIGSDMNGWIHQPAPRFGPDACAGNRAQAALQEGPVVYPFNVHGEGWGPASGNFGKLITGHRTFDINIDGFAHIGMLPDFIHDLKKVGLTDENLEPLFNSAEAYLQVWENATQQSQQ